MYWVAKSLSKPSMRLYSSTVFSISLPPPTITCSKAVFIGSPGARRGTKKTIVIEKNIEIINVNVLSTRYFL